MNIAKKSGCFACHDIDKKKVGPPWKKVAERYQKTEGAREELIKSIKKGSKGKWKELTKGAVMPANSPRISDETIEKLVDFILALK